MGMIAAVGRRHWRTRLLLAVIMLLLIVGGITMLYPFGLMIAGSTNSAIDEDHPRLIPRYLINDNARRGCSTNAFIC